MTEGAQSRERIDRESGYALVAAVSAMAAFAYIAFQVLAADGGAIALADGRLERARLVAAADAGIALAINGLAADDRGSRWSIDGRTRRVSFSGTDLTVVVEDERGKAPLAGLNDQQARTLFEGGGASGERLDALVAEFREWQTEDMEIHNPPLPPPDRPIRHGPFATVDELAGLKDMDPTLLARIAPVATTFFEENGPFDPRNASPLAKATMNADIIAPEDPETLAQEAQAAEERPDEDIGSNDRYYGRTLTIRVTARAPDGARASRMAIVELTGAKANPYYIRYTQ